MSKFDDLEHRDEKLKKAHLKKEDKEAVDDANIETTLDDLKQDLKEIKDDEKSKTDEDNEEDKEVEESEDNKKNSAKPPNDLRWLIVALVAAVAVLLTCIILSATPLIAHWAVKTIISLAGAISVGTVVIAGRKLELQRRENNEFLENKKKEKEKKEEYEEQQQNRYKKIDGKKVKKDREEHKDDEDNKEKEDEKEKKDDFLSNIFSDKKEDKKEKEEDKSEDKKEKKEEKDDKKSDFLSNLLGTNKDDKKEAKDKKDKGILGGNVMDDIFGKSENNDVKKNSKPEYDIKNSKNSFLNYENNRRKNNKKSKGFGRG